MPRNVLIVHAKDASAQANALVAQLSARGYSAETYATAMKKMPLSSYFVQYRESLVENAALVIVIPSPELLADAALMSVVYMAIESAKFVPVLHGFPGLILPLSMGIYTSVNFDNPDTFDREMARLISSLQYHGL